MLNLDPQELVLDSIEAEERELWSMDNFLYPKKNLPESALSAKPKDHVVIHPDVIAASGPEQKVNEVRGVLGGNIPDFNINGEQQLKSLLSRIIIGSWKNDSGVDFNAAIEMKSIMRGLNPFLKAAMPPLKSRHWTLSMHERRTKGVVRRDKMKMHGPQCSVKLRRSMLFYSDIVNQSHLITLS